MKRIIDLLENDEFYIDGTRYIVILVWKSDDKPLVAKLDDIGYWLSFFENPEQEVSISVEKQLKHK